MMFDHMMLDGLEDAYSRNEKTGEGRSMGTFAEECVGEVLSSPAKQQDAFAIESVKRAQNATNDGGFDWEIAPGHRHRPRRRHRHRARTKAR